MAGVLACIDTATIEKGPADCSIVTPLCAEQPKPGQTCNPACQTGCPCGRCAVVDGKTTCLLTVGEKKLGDVCDTANDGCGPGLACIEDHCGANNMGRCRNYCNDDSGCTGATTCATPIPATNPVATVCDDVPLRTYSCDPVTNTGCPPALMCYLVGSETSCACPGASPLGGTCAVSLECGVGMTCILVGSATTATCYTVCDLAAPNCPRNTPLCFALGGSSNHYGYCSAQ
jgi:hypothetical protein